MLTFAGKLTTTKGGAIHGFSSSSQSLLAAARIVQLLAYSPHTGIQFFRDTMTSPSFSQCLGDEASSCVSAGQALRHPTTQWMQEGDAWYSPQEDNTAILTFSGHKIEVWGWQKFGGRGTDGNSTYIVDGETLFKNTGLSKMNSSTASMLFSKTDLSYSPHTVTVRNAGVHLTLGYFKVQAPAASTQTPVNTLSSTSTQAMTTSEATTTSSTSYTPSQIGNPQSTSPSLGTESISVEVSTVYISKDGTAMTSVYTSAMVVNISTPPETTMAGSPSPSSTIAHDTPLSSNTSGSSSHESGHSTPLIAATATVTALFLLFIVAGVWLYKKHFRRKDIVTVFHLEPTKRTAQQEEWNEKRQFSPTASITPTLPEYEYTSHDVQLMRGSNMDRPDGPPAVEYWNESPPYAGPLVPLRMADVADAEIS